MKPYFWEKGFPNFETQISCLQCEANFLSSGIGAGDARDATTYPSKFF